MKWNRIVVMFVATSVVAPGLVGCAMSSDVLQAKSEVIQNNDKQTVELTQQHLKVMAGDVEGIRVSVVEVERQAAVNAERLEQELRDALERERKIKERIGAVISAMTQSLGASLGGGFGGMIGGAVGDAINAGIDAAVDNAAANASTLVKASEERTGERMARVRDKADLNSEDIRSTNRTMNELESRLAKLPSEIQERVNALKGTMDSELAQIRLATGPAEQSRQLEQLLLSKGLTQAEINKLNEQFGTNALMLLLGGGTLLGAGGGTMASRLGKSRSKGEIDKLADKVSALESAVKKA